MKNIPFARPNICNKEIKEVSKTLRSPILVHGPKIIKFEDEFKKFTKAPYAVSVSSCTAGMHLIYFTLGLGAGDEVLLPSQSHVATAHAIELTGAKPIFIDVDKAEHIGSMFTFRTVLPDREKDDARPTLIENIDDNIFNLFSGKIGTCVDAANGVINDIK